MSSPHSTQSAVSELLKRFGELSERLGSIGAAVHELFRSFRTLAELANRAAFRLAGMVGLPRPIRGDLFHAIAGSAHGKPAGAGASASAGGYKSHEELMAEIRERHDLKRQLEMKDRHEDEQHWETISRKNELRKKRDRLYDAAVPSEANRQAGPGGWKTPKAAVHKTDPQFVRKAYAAVKFAEAQGWAAPAYRPHDSAYRDWVDEIHKQSQTLAPPAAKAPAATAAPAASASTKAPTTFGGRVKAALASNSFAPLLPGGLGKAFAYAAESAQTCARSFLGVAAVTQGLLQAASPVAFDTFTDSIKLLAAQVGTTLIPFFLDLSQVVQDLAAGFASLSPSTKDLVGQFLKWVIIGAGIAALFTGLAALVTPVGLLVVGFAAAATALEHFIGKINEASKQPQQMTQEELEKTADYDDVRKQVYQKRIDALGEIPAKGTPEFKEWKRKRDLATEAAITPEEVKDVIPGMIDESLDKAKELHKEIAKTFPKGVNTQMLNSWDPATAFFSHMAMLNPETRAAVEKQNQAGVLETHASILSSLMDRLKGIAPQEDPGSRASRLLMSYSSIKGNSQFMSVEQAWKRTQISALGDDPITAQLRRIQMEGLDPLNKRADKTNLFLESIDKTLRQMW